MKWISTPLGILLAVYPSMKSYQKLKRKKWVKFFTISLYFAFFIIVINTTIKGRYNSTVTAMFLLHMVVTTILFSFKVMLGMLLLGWGLFALLGYVDLHFFWKIFGYIEEINIASFITISAIVLGIIFFIRRKTTHAFWQERFFSRYSEQTTIDIYVQSRNLAKVDQEIGIALLSHIDRSLDPIVHFLQEKKEEKLLEILDRFYEKRKLIESIVKVRSSIEKNLYLEAKAIEKIDLYALCMKALRVLYDMDIPVRSGYR